MSIQIGFFFIFADLSRHNSIFTEMVPKKSKLTQKSIGALCLI